MARAGCRVIAAEWRGIHDGLKNNKAALSIQRGLV